MINGRRPFRIVILAALSLVIAGFNCLRLVQSVVSWSILSEYHLLPGPLYTAISGGFWFLINLVILYGLMRTKAWSLRAFLAGAIGYFAWYWLDRLILQSYHANWIFSLGISISYLLLGIIIVGSSRKILHLPGTGHEQEIKNKYFA